MKRNLILALALVLGITACGGTATSVPTTAPTLPPTAVPPVVHTVGYTTITMINQSGETIFYVRISPTGEDWAPTVYETANGESQIFEVEPGDWDVRAMNDDGDRIDEINGITVTAASGYEWIVMPAPQAPSGSNLRIINNSRDAICYVSITPATAADRLLGPVWGPSEAIQRYDSRFLTVPPGQYDAQMMDCTARVDRHPDWVWRSMNIEDWSIIRVQ